MTTFTKSVFAVELDGKPYAIVLPVEKMNELLILAAKMSNGSSLQLSPMPNDDFFAVAMTTNHRPAARHAVDVKNPFEMRYDPELKALTVTSTAPVSGEVSDVRFDGQSTRALFDCLLAASDRIGGPLGEETTVRTVQ